MILMGLNSKVVHLAPTFEDGFSYIQIARGTEIIELKSNLNLINYDTYIHRDLSLVFGDGDVIFTLKDGGVLSDSVWEDLRDRFLLDNLEATTLICGGHMYKLEKI